ncbi:HugZ family protein [Chelativorans sp. M5D2P16]|uniref:HugZ family pyridoxamine 5'-phosphate oxidase n=1 Tax=Chelativorans sp. M5D2P16 TaxID=3095678 RepID=UPI002ACB03DE|nr:HugZ family protein [Chelativorans sp. M5D2P16]MDZ5697933.1 HugZ family protein [Chelativorans sp. M5D2P16]
MAKTDPILETNAEAIRLAKTLLRTARFGALATLDPADGAPQVTRVAVATGMDGAPLILVSALSAHTRALEADPRCSLLVGEPGKGDPLAHPRLTLKARADKLARDTDEHAHAKRRYLNRHPKARLYADFADFAFHRLSPEGAALNGGFARAYRLDRADVVTTSPANEALVEMEQGALDHMNADHADAVKNYAVALAGGTPGKWSLTGIDADGIDLARGDEVRRVFFDAPLEEAAQMRPVLVAMAKRARGA